jgi:hypothetical protein
MKIAVAGTIIMMAMSGGALAQVSTPPSGASGGGSDRPVATGSGSTVSGSPAMTPGTAATTGSITPDPRDPASAGSTGSPPNTGNPPGNPPAPNTPAKQ